MILRPENPHQISFKCRADEVVDEPVVTTIDQIVGRLDLSDLYGRYSEHGRSFYDPSMMLKVLFFSYCEGVRSSREIAKRIRYDIRYRYYTGNLVPDFRTINRFRLENLDLLGDYFSQIVSQAEDAGYLDVSVLAIDGTKIRASASGRRAAKQKQRDELADRYREELRRDASGEESETSRPVEDDSGDSSNDIDSSGIGKSSLSEVRSSELKVSDPDARFMKTSEGGRRLSYNSHIAVDNGRLIVAAEVSTCADDSVQLASMIAHCRENLDGEPGAVLADGGYYSGNNVKQSVQTGVDLYMPISATGQVPDQRYHRDAFVYDAESDSYICPAGERLPYKSQHCRKNVTKKIYAGSASSCGHCLQRTLCTKSRYRRLEISENYRYELQMKCKLASERGREIYSRRMALVEGVFGNLKFNLGFIRFCVRGLAKVRGEFFLMCIAHNLKKLARLIRHTPPAEAAHVVVKSVFCALWNLYQRFLKTLRANLWTIRINPLAG